MSNVLYCNNQYEWCDTCLVTKLWSISLGTMTEDNRIPEFWKSQTLHALQLQGVPKITKSVEITYC
jgi:hypothetical protein